MENGINPLRKGMLLAWLPIGLVCIPICINSVRFTDRDDAIGHGIVAALAILGAISLIACEGYAIRLLAKSFSHPPPGSSSKPFAVVSILIGVLFTGLITLTLVVVLRFEWKR
jgi:hypothetical protein